MLASAPSSRAQDCSWNVDLNGAAHRWLTLASDGGHGVLAVSYPERWRDHGTISGTLRLHHVLEHGAEDPAFPSGGVTFFTPPPGETRRGVMVMSALPDDAGGAWVLAMHNDPTAPHLRPYETATFRVHHVNASGEVAPGWVAGGLLLNSTFGSPTLIDHADMVADGAGGVIVAWIAPATYPRSHVRAQRFAADGTPVWPGGSDGVMVSDSLRVRSALRVAGDGAGGLGAAVSTQLNLTSERNAHAFRVPASGVPAWPAAGVLVYGELGLHESPDALAFDETGNLFVLFRSIPSEPDLSFTLAQLLNPNGSRLFNGSSGLELSQATFLGGSVTSTPAGFVTVHATAPSGTAMQLLDASGTTYWGGGAEGVPSPPFERPPVRFSDGTIMFVWADPPSFFDGPPTVIHALQIGGDGAPAPGWAADGVVVCGALFGHILTDAFTPDGEVLMVGLGTDEYSTIEPRILRLSRQVLGTEDPPLPRALDLSTPAPNPSRGEWTVKLSLPSASEVTLEVFDISGRRVLSHDVGLLPAGRHTLARPTRGTLAPGVYRLRARTSAGVAERMLVSVR
jgi:hypothetical protein